MDYFKKGGEKLSWGWMKRLKRESERRDKRWAQSVDLTHSIHPLFLDHPFLVHAFTPPTPPFFALAFVLVLPVCLSGRLNADVMEREHRGGGSAMKPLSKPRLGIVFMSSPLSPKTGPLPLWAPILQMERGWAAAAQRYGSCLLRPVLRARVPSSTEHS